MDYCFLAIEGKTFDFNLSKANSYMIEALSNFSEIMISEDRVYITEKEAESLKVKTKQFFAKVITVIQNLRSSIQNSIESKLREKTFKDKLSKLHSELKEKQKSGIRKVEVVDVWSYTDTYVRCVDDLKSISKKFSKMNYKRTADIDRDIESFENTCVNYEKNLEKLSEKKITVPVSKMIDFVEYEISGRSRVLITLNDCITMMKQMQIDVETLEIKKEILGPEILPKHVGFLRRIANRISAFIKRWTIKILTATILLLG